MKERDERAAKKASAAMRSVIPKKKDTLHLEPDCCSSRSSS